MGFIAEYFGLQKKPIGLDISPASVKAVELKKRGEGIIVSKYGNSPLPPNIFSENEIIGKKVLVDRIKKALEEAQPHRIETKYASCSLPEGASFNKLLTLPKMKRGELEEAVHFQANQFIPLSPEEIYLDWELIPLKKEEKFQIKVFLVAAPKALVDNYLEVLNLAGITPLAFEIETVAMTRSLLPLLEGDIGTIIFDIGAKTTRIIIFDQGIIQLTGSLLVGGEEITLALARELNLSLEEAEKLKKHPPREKSFSLRFRKAIGSAMEHIAHEARQSIKFYQEHSGRKVQKAILCGGSAALLGIKRNLSKDLGIKVEKANLSLTGSPIPPSQTLLYTTAIGLALRGQENV